MAINERIDHRNYKVGGNDSLEALIQEADEVGLFRKGLITSPKTEMIPITNAPIIFANKVPQKEDTLKLQ